MSDFGKYLQHPDNRQAMSFDLRETGYDVRDHQAGNDRPERREMRLAGWEHRRWEAADERIGSGAWPRRRRLPTRPMRARRPNLMPRCRPMQPLARRMTDKRTRTQRRCRRGIRCKRNRRGRRCHERRRFAAERPGPGRSDARSLRRWRWPAGDADIFNKYQPAEKVFDAAKEQHTGVVLGIAMAMWSVERKEHFRVLPGDDVKLTFPTAASRRRPSIDKFTIVDFYESKMSEYDAQLRLRAARRSCSSCAA